MIRSDIYLNPRLTALNTIKGAIMVLGIDEVRADQLATLVIMQTDEWLYEQKHPMHDIYLT